MRQDTAAISTAITAFATACSDLTATHITEKTKVGSALSNLPELRKAFGNSDLVDATKNGFAKRYGLLASAVLGTRAQRTEGARLQHVQCGLNPTLQTLNMGPFVRVTHGLSRLNRLPINNHLT